MDTMPLVVESFALTPHFSGGNRVTLKGSIQATIMNHLEDFARQRAGWKSDEVIQGVISADGFYASEWAQARTPLCTKNSSCLSSMWTMRPVQQERVSAWPLMGHISKASWGPKKGLKGYEEQIRPLINEMQQIPPLVLGISAPQTAWRVRLRNMVFPFIC
ncbi:uncharacterized protein N7503_007653 [Penicillium pulvis]|uniref:uncharacterized protein n=1 Tax=Penicillium pulvis TaxID=1562058 RepID=UPI0025472A4E|nr:uncharacterized protein N7503_007653 [Penicillium pulvis]KAJ5798357.1 hypothetical protein N7503_007653 [Penicillium pulvis]